MNITEGFVGPTDNVYVAYEGKDGADYDLYVLTANREDTLLHRDLDNREDLSYNEKIDLSKNEFEVKIGHSYIVEIRDHGDNRCGTSGFTVTDSGEPPNDIKFVAGNPKSSYEPAEIGTTLKRIGVQGLTQGTKYKFALHGRWDGDWLREKNGRGPEFTADSDTIIVENICENGEGNRTDCGDTFRLGDYVIELQLASNSQTLARASFRVDAEAAEFGDPIWRELDTESPAIKNVTTLLNFAIGMAGGIAFLLMIFGSYRLIFAGGNPESIQQGREVITAAITGLIVIVFSVFILRFLGIAIFGIP